MRERNLEILLPFLDRVYLKVILSQITDLFQYIWRFDFEDLQTRIHFNNLFFETLNELDLETQELILHALKLDIERRMKVVSHDFEKFEQARFMIRADYDKVALECFCSNCDRLVYIWTRFARL